MVNLTHTSIDELAEIHASLGKIFRSGLTRPLDWRRSQLYQLARLVQDNADALAEALFKDLGKPRQECLAMELGPIVERSLLSAAQLEEWAAPELVEVPDWQKSWNPTIHKQPKGVVVIIAPWNYPFILAIQPLIGAIAAGCTAVVKPSELAPNCAQLLAGLFPKYLDPVAFRVVNGGVSETTKLLEYKWDHIFYTGNGRVARIISAAAAKFLTPITLELGGKSPVIIDDKYDIKLAAKRILWGKCNNSGQICVAPDYILIAREKQDELIAAFKEYYKEFFPEGALKSPSYGRIVNPTHHARLKSLLDKTKGQVVIGGNTEGTNGIEPTVLRDVPYDDPLMEDEIFGPILPIVPVDSVDQTIDFIGARSHPLVLYVFTEDADLKQRMISQTTSGTLVFNDTFQQLAVNELPFSGIGESGQGYQILRYTYDGFTHLRSSVDIPKTAEPFLQVRYPPYQEGSENFKTMTAALASKIPSSRK